MRAGLKGCATTTNSQRATDSLSNVGFHVAPPPLDFHNVPRLLESATLGEQDGASKYDEHGCGAQARPSDGAPCYQH